MSKTLLSLLNSDNYNTYNKTIAREIGLEAAIFLGHVAYKYQKFEKDGVLREDGWFYLTIEDVQYDTALTRYGQEAAIKSLKNLGVLEVKLMGQPGRRHFRINLDKIPQILGLEGGGATNKLAENSKLGCRKQQTGPSPRASLLETMNKEVIINTPPNPLKGDGVGVPAASSSVLEKGRFVKLPSDEYDKLCDEHGETTVSQIIDEMNDYVEATGKKYKSYAAAIRNWIRRRKDRQKESGRWKDSRRSRSQKNPDGTDTENEYKDLF